MSISPYLRPICGSLSPDGEVLCLRDYRHLGWHRHEGYEWAQKLTLPGLPLTRALALVDLATEGVTV